MEEVAQWDQKLCAWDKVVLNGADWRGCGPCGYYMFDHKKKKHAVMPSTTLNQIIESD
jgi:hypothetical protein